MKTEAVIKHMIEYYTSMLLIANSIEEVKYYQGLVQGLEFTLNKTGDIE